MRLTGKVALVTGAQQGIGKAIALAYGREGADVVVNYLDDSGLAEEIVGQIRQAGPRAVAVQGSVAQPDDISAMVAAGEAFGYSPLILLKAFFIFAANSSSSGKEK